MTINCGSRERRPGEPGAPGPAQRGANEPRALEDPAVGKIGAFVGTYALTSLLPRIGLADTSVIVGCVAVVGALVTVVTLPEPKGQSLESIVDEQLPR